MTLPRERGDTNGERCPECGAPVAGGQAGCQSLFEEMGFRATQDRRLAVTHRLAVDAYCMQHVEPYCHSAKSYAAHLTSLCCGVEQGGVLTIYAAIQQWLNGQVALEKPSVLSQRGSMTIVEVLADQDVEATFQRIKDWADGVWAAYATQQELARGWIKLALERQPKRK